MEADILQFIQQHPPYAYLAVLGVLLACGLGVPLPEDITLVAGGYTVYLAQTHGLDSPSLGPMIAVGMIGVLSGDTILFMLGRWLGPRAASIWPFRKLFTPRRLERTRRYFQRYGIWTAFFARFAAGVRAPTYMLAGSMGMRFRTFLLADASAALISVPLLVWLAWRFGAQIDRVKVWLANSKYALLALFLALGVYLLVRALVARRRRRLSELQAQQLETEPATGDDGHPSRNGNGKPAGNGSPGSNRATAQRSPARVSEALLAHAESKGEQLRADVSASSRSEN